VKDGKECRQGAPESRERLGKGDPQMSRVDQRHRGKPEIGAQEHAQPAQGEAHDRSQILHLSGAEQAGDARPQQESNDHVLCSPDIAEAVPQPVEHQVGKDVSDGNDNERSQGCLHVITW
jgi:hypothetical protein